MRDDERIDQVEKALKRAYLRQTEMEVNTAWRSALMMTIRRLEAKRALGPEERSLALTWRFALVTSSIAICLSAWAFYSGIMSEHGVARVFLRDPAGLLPIHFLIP